MNTTSKLSHAESKAREAKKAVRGVVRRLSVHSKEGVVQTLVQGYGPPIGTAYCGVWRGTESANDGLTNLRRLIANGLDRKSREIVARNTKIVRTQRIK